MKWVILFNNLYLLFKNEKNKNQFHSIHYMFINDEHGFSIQIG